MGPGTGEGSSRGPAAIQIALLLGPYDPADPLLLVADRDGVCSLWQDPM